MAISEDELTKRLAEARPEGVTVGPAVVAGLVMSTRNAATLRRSRHGWAALTGAAVLAISALTVAPAGATGIHWVATQLGWAPAATGEVLPDSEWVDLRASDLPSYVDAAFPSSLALAPQSSREGIVSRVVAESQAMGGLMQSIGLRLRMEQLILDGWLQEWQTAHARGDERRAAEAAQLIGEAAQWPAITATDGGGVRRAMVELSDAIRHGDPTAAQQLAQLLAIPSWDNVERSIEPLDGQP